MQKMDMDGLPQTVRFNLVASHVFIVDYLSRQCEKDSK